MSYLTVLNGMAVAIELNADAMMARAGSFIVDSLGRFDLCVRGSWFFSALKTLCG